MPYQHSGGGYHWGYDGFQYKFHEERKTWKEAEEICEEEDAHLAMEKTALNHDYIYSIWQWSSFWIGVNDFRQKGHWRFVDGTPVNVTYWNPGEPSSDQGLEFCVQYAKKYNTDDKGWNDLRCDTELAFLCQKGKIETVDKDFFIEY